MKIGFMNDEELVGSALRGNQDATQELVTRYREYAMAAAMTLLMNREDAEDACQEAFFKAFRSLSSFDKTRSFKTWFSAVLYNQCLDLLRRKKRLKQLLVRLPKERPETVSVVDPARESSVNPDTLRRLSPKERTALFLWSQEGSSGEEIAAVLGCARKTAYVHLYRARVKLKSLLKEKSHGQ
jgi:RNA polymerase sigma-70 factor (ECF subfamily)